MSPDDAAAAPGNDLHAGSTSARGSTGRTPAEVPGLASTSTRVSARGSARPPASATGLSLLTTELTLLFRRTRTWAMLAALAAVPVLIAVAVRLSSAGSSPGRGPAFLASITENGLFVALTGLTVAIPLFLPLTIAVVAGDTIAGEANLGTLRYLLVAPAGRLRLLLVKLAGAAAFCVAATATLVVAGIVIGAVLFPIGPVTLLSGEQIGLGDYLLRCVLLVAYVTVSLLGFSAIGLFISTLTVVPVGAMAATAVLSAVSQIVGALPQLEWAHPWLFTQHWFGFADLLRQPIAWESFGQNALLQLGYIAVFGSLAALRFHSRDVLS